MDNIKKLIDEAEDRKKSHHDRYIDAMNSSRMESYHNGREDECDFFIFKLKLLLKDESKQPQPPDCANTMLGEVPHGVNDQPGENLKAVEGATPVVRQNEQTKEVCPSCKSEDLFDVDDHWTKCNSCGFSFVG